MSLAVDRVIAGRRTIPGGYRLEADVMRTAAGVERETWYVTRGRERLLRFDDRRDAIRALASMVGPAETREDE